jgi:type I restriction enzyme R subunit
MDAYNTQYGTNHSISEFDKYYQDVQGRIKAHKWPVGDYPRAQRIDITIVVDMLLTGFDSKYLNTLYVDKNLKYHCLIQAFSRTNRILNDTKPYGNVLDFRQQKAAVDTAIALFSGVDKGRAKEIWLVDPAPVVLKRYEEAVKGLETFMQSQGLTAQPQEVSNLMGDEAKGGFIEKFKEVQRLRTQLDQYTDLDEEERAKLEAVLPTDDLRAFRGQYIDVAKDLRDRQGKGGKKGSPVDQLDFEFVLFASAIIDYDYILKLMAASTGRSPKKQTMTREQIIALLGSSANLMDEADEMAAYFAGLPTDRGFSEEEIRKGYEVFKQRREAAVLSAIAAKHGLRSDMLQGFAKEVAGRAVFDSELLAELLAPLELGWKARAAKEGEIVAELKPLLKKMAQGREISGLDVYEH